jgi:hypothetical protein
MMFCRNKIINLDWTVLKINKDTKKRTPQYKRHFLLILRQKRRLY